MLSSLSPDSKQEAGGLLATGCHLTPTGEGGHRAGSTSRKQKGAQRARALQGLLHHCLAPAFIEHSWIRHHTEPAFTYITTQYVPGKARTGEEGRLGAAWLTVQGWIWKQAIRFLGDKPLHYPFKMPVHGFP